ncbi:hypothetical protein BM528_15840 [Alteromonas sp. RW2A1]|uniref:glycosyltransferase n=1 Tax=Alteromonas sp. RW2A1 TaxID=1917158 RepID=UPI0009033537|nr:glycosyltransferase [Alteromonas sp. RW2A1]APE07064.1 hypothetical protein BM528_15840 [Alteromonas sp. RW2A1]
MADYCVIQNSLKTTYVFRRNYLVELIAKKNKVTVLAPNDCEDSKIKLRDLGVVIPYVPSNNFAYTYLIMNLRILYLRLFKNNTYICHFISTYALTFITLLPFNKKLVVSIEGLGSFFTERRLARKVIRYLITRNNVVRVFCNNDERQSLGKPKDFVMGGIGVELASFEQSEGQSNNLIYVGRLIKDKGIYDVISVFRKLRERGVKLTLTVVGDVYKDNPSSISAGDIESLKSEFSDSILFTGYVPDVSNHYSHSDLLLLPSKREGFPVCVMEANASGIPALVYDVPGCSDAVLNNVNGYRFDKNNFLSIVSKIEFLYENPIILKELKRTSRAYALENFSISNKTFSFLNEIETRLKKV